MAREAQPDFRVNVYGNDPGRVTDVQRDLTLGGPQGGGGGIPWFPRSRPSPTHPTTTGAPRPIDAQMPWELAPHAQPPGYASPNLPGTGIGGGLAGLFAGLSARDMAALVAALTGTIGGAVAGRNRGTMNPTTGTADPQLQALMQSMQGRLDKSEPLYDSIMAMANGLLPTQYQKGGGGMR